MSIDICQRETKGDCEILMVNKLREEKMKKDTRNYVLENYSD
jgi:hypothetical protein